MKSLLSILRNAFRSSRPARKPASRLSPRKTTLSVEQLEGRLVASANPINYLSLPGGTYSYNDTTHVLREITSVRPSMMTSNGYTLDAAYGNGLWSYDYNSGSWTHLTSAVPTTMDLGAPVLFASFNSSTMKGTYSFDGSWHKLSNMVGFKIAAIGPGQFQEFVGGNGLYDYQSYNNSWTREAIPAGSTFYTMGASGYTTVIGLNTGTFVSDNMGQSWTKISNSHANQIAMIGTDDFFVTFSTGTDRCTNDRLTTIFSAPAQAIGAGTPGYDQYQLLGSWSNGTFANLNGHWTRISTAEASLIV